VREASAQRAAGAHDARGVGPSEMQSGDGRRIGKWGEVDWAGEVLAKCTFISVLLMNSLIYHKNIASPKSNKSQFSSSPRGLRPLLSRWHFALYTKKYQQLSASMKKCYVSVLISVLKL